MHCERLADSEITLTHHRLASIALAATPPHRCCIEPKSPKPPGGIITRVDRGARARSNTNMWSPAIDRQANQEAEDFFGSLEEPPPPYAVTDRLNPSSTTSRCRQPPRGAPPEAAPSRRRRSRPRRRRRRSSTPRPASTTVGDNPEATAPRTAVSEDCGARPPGARTRRSTRRRRRNSPSPRPRKKSGEDAGWGVQDLGDDDDEDVWNDSPTRRRHTRALTIIS